MRHLHDHGVLRDALQTAERALLAPDEVELRDNALQSIQAALDGCLTPAEQRLLQTTQRLEQSFPGLTRELSALVRHGTDLVRQGVAPEAARRHVIETLQAAVQVTDPAEPTRPGERRPTSLVHRAYKVICPRCMQAPGHPCLKWNSAGQLTTIATKHPHPERKQLAAKAATKQQENS